MAKNENKEVVEEIQEQPKEQKEQAAIKTNEEVADAKINTPVEKEGGDMKMKAKPKKPKQFVNKEEDEVIKVDLTKKAEEEDKVEGPIDPDKTEYFRVIFTSKTQLPVTETEYF